MSNNLAQTELDMAEEYILTCLFGDPQKPKINDIVKSYMALSGKNPINIINNGIDKFENIFRPLIKDNGYVDGEKLSKLLEIKLNQKIALEDFRLIDGARAIESMLLYLGKFIQ